MLGIPGLLMWKSGSKVYVIDGINMAGGKLFFFIISTLSRAVSGFFLFFLALFIAKFCGPNSRGDFAIISSIATVVGIVGGASLGRAVLPLVVLAKHKTEIYISLSAVKTIKLTFLASISIPLCYFFLNVDQAVVYIVVTIPFSFYYAWQAYAPQAFSALGKLRNYDVIVILTRSICLICVLILVLFFDIRFWGVLFFGAASIIIFILIELNILVDFRLYRRASKSDCRELYSTGLSLHIDSISGLAAAPILMMIAAIYLSRNELGSLALASQFLAPLTILPGVFNLLIVRKLAISRNVLDAHKLNSILILFFLSFLTTLISIGVIVIFSNEIILIVGSNYLSATKYLTYSIFFALSFPLSQSFVPLWSILGYSRILSVVSLTTTIIGLLLGFMLIPKYGGMGVLYSQMFIYGSSVAFHIYLVSKIFFKK